RVDIAARRGPALGLSPDARAVGVAGFFLVGFVAVGVVRGALSTALAALFARAGVVFSRALVAITAARIAAVQARKVLRDAGVVEAPAVAILVERTRFRSPAFEVFGPTPQRCAFGGWV